MKDKIGILTFHDTTNFGSVLQSYALCKAIRNLGGYAELIDYQCSAIVEREHLNTTGTGLKRIIKYILFGHRNQEKHKAILGFLRNESMISLRQYNKDNISEANQQYNCFVSGSDIIWGLDITRNDLTYFLDFTELDKNRYAFASSIGDRWPTVYDDDIGKLLRRYNEIYVREKNAVEIVKEVSGKETRLVSDPTMLLDAEYWKKLAGKGPYNKKYVLVYFGNETLIQEAKKYASNYGCQVLLINYGIPHKGVKNIRPVSVNEFLGLIKNAQFIFTGSYHGMLFSLYFQKQFVVFNRAHSSRMLTILEDLGLCDCILTDSKFSYPNVDYSIVTPKIEKKRSESIECLKRIVG